MPVDELTALGQKMRQARKNAGLTQQELSDQSHVSVKQIANIEKGKMQMLFSMVQDGELSIEKAAGKVNIPASDFEKQMEEAGYKIPSAY